MRPQRDILNHLMLFMAFMILVAHVVPLSLQFLDNSTCINVLLVEPEEEVKELVHEAPAQVPVITPYYFGEYTSFLQPIPPSPYMETLSPPPDFI